MFTVTLDDIWPNAKVIRIRLSLTLAWITTKDVPREELVGGGWGVRPLQYRQNTRKVGHNAGNTSIWKCNRGLACNSFIPLIMVGTNHGLRQWVTMLDYIWSNASESSSKGRFPLKRLHQFARSGPSWCMRIRLTRTNSEGWFPLIQIHSFKWKPALIG